METREEYLIGEWQSRRAEYLRDCGFDDIILDEETKSEIKEFAQDVLLKKGFSKEEIAEWGWEEFDECYEEVREFSIDKIIEGSFDIKQFGDDYCD